MKFAADGVRLMISDEFARPSRLWKGSRFPSSEAAGRIGQLGVDDAHSKSVPNLKDDGPGRDQRRPGRRLLQTLHLGLFRHFQCA
jgi:hypothetical protein